jgi:hypothetical protein
MARLTDFHRQQSIRDTEIVGIREEAVFKTKNSDKGKMANTKMYCP